MVSSAPAARAPRVALSSVSGCGKGVCWLGQYACTPHNTTLTDTGSRTQERSDRALHVPTVRGKRLARLGRAELRDRLQQEGDSRLLAAPNPSTFTTSSTAAAAAANATTFAATATATATSDALNSTAATTATAETEAQLQVNRCAVGECGALQVHIPAAVAEAQLQPLQATDELQRERLRDADGRRVAGRRAAGRRVVRVGRREELGARVQHVRRERRLVVRRACTAECCL